MDLKQMKTYIHKYLGKVTIDEGCEFLNKTNPDTSSIFVVHNGEVKEVTKSLVKEAGNENLLDK